MKKSNIDFSNPFIREMWVSQHRTAVSVLGILLVIIGVILSVSIYSGISFLLVNVLLGYKSFTWKFALAVGVLLFLFIPKHN